MGGRGGMGGVRVEGLKLDPLSGADDESKPLLSKLLAVPSLRARYLGYVREITTRWLDWKTLGPVAVAHHRRIAAEVAADTRKLSTTAAFTESLVGGNQAPVASGRVGGGGPGRPDEAGAPSDRLPPGPPDQAGRQGGPGRPEGPEGAGPRDMLRFGPGGGGPRIALKAFADQRREYLLGRLAELQKQR
jgi:hypothetical protein